MVMVDNNSDDVARLIRGWFAKQGFEK